MGPTRAPTPAPTASPTTVDCGNMGGSDCSASLQSWAGAGNCVALVTTNYHNCRTYCANRYRGCVKAMNNVGSCGLNKDGHNRQSTAEDGCLQKWGDQICVCGSISRWQPFLYVWFARLSLGVAMVREPEAKEPGLESIVLFCCQTHGIVYKKLTNAKRLRA